MHVLKKNFRTFHWRLLQNNMALKVKFRAKITVSYDLCSTDNPVSKLSGSIKLQNNSLLTVSTLLFIKESWQVTSSRSSPGLFFREGG